MRKYIYSGLLALILAGGLVTSARAQESDLPLHYTPPKTEYYKARVAHIGSTTSDNDPNDPEYIQSIENVTVIFLNGPEKGNNREVPYYSKTNDPKQRLQSGDIVYIAKISDAENTYYAVADRYRLPGIIWITLGFIVLALIIGRLKTLGSLGGLACTLFVIMWFIVPQIMAGHNPLIACLIGSIAIALVSLYIAHGFNIRTSLAVASTIAIILITLGLDYAVIHWLNLFGTGTEEAVYAQFTQSGTINLRGLLLGGILIGVLGVLDDITTAQAAVVGELRRANPLLTFKELFFRGMSVGKEHIASLINTLILAYVGASFPLVLLFKNYEQPLAFIINSELVAEEIARALIGSTALILAVPLTTALSAYVLIKRKPGAKKIGGHPHAHH